MKRVIILFVCGIMLTSCGNNTILSTGRSVLEKTTIKSVVYKAFVAQPIATQIEFFKKPTSEEDYTLFYAIQRILAFVVLLSVLLVVMGAPVLLGFYWFENLFRFHEECKKNVIPNSKEESDRKKPPCLSDRIAYKRIYSSLYGNGFGFIGWIILTLWHVLSNFDSLSLGLKSYFSFPFAAMRDLDITQSNLFSQVSGDVWASMLLIVGISLVLYVIGRFIGNALATKYLRKANFYYLELDS